MEKYLRLTEIMDYDHPTIRSVVNSLSGEKSRRQDVLTRLFYAVRDGCRYNMYRGSWDLKDYQASKVLWDGEGYCVQKSVLLAALARAAGIPSRFILAAIRNHQTPPEVVKAMGNNLFFPHIYDEFYINDCWIKVAPTFDKYLCRRLNVPTVEFRGDHDAILPPFDFEGRPYIEYIYDFGTFEDIPWEFILKTLPRFYNKEYFAWQASLNPGIDWRAVGVETDGVTKTE